MNPVYECASCNRSNVKLWRPYGYSTPLICARCAEIRQSPFEYEEMKYIKVNDGHYQGTPTCKKIKGKRWVVDSSGQVPSYDGPGPDNLNVPMTDQLIVNISDIDNSWSSGRTTMVPAIPDDDGLFWCYTTVPEDKIAWWKALPTR